MRNRGDLRGASWRAVEPLDPRTEEIRTSFHRLLDARHSIECSVRDIDTARAYGSGEVNVLATPALIALIEGAARDAVQADLPGGHTTVGSLVNVRHLAPTPAGHTVKVHVTVSGVEGRRVVFKVEAHDSAGMIAEGVHERFVVDIERFAQKAQARFAGHSG